MALTSSSPRRPFEFVRPHGSAQCALDREGGRLRHLELDKKAPEGTLAVVRAERL